MPLSSNWIGQLATNQLVGIRVPLGALCCLGATGFDGSEPRLMFRQGLLRGFKSHRVHCHERKNMGVPLVVRGSIPLAHDLATWRLIAHICCQFCGYGVTGSMLSFQVSCASSSLAIRFSDHRLED